MKFTHSRGAGTYSLARMMCCLAFSTGCQTAATCYEDGGVVFCNGLARPTGSGAGTGGETGNVGFLLMR